jgi:hypothetical protein
MSKSNDTKLVPPKQKKPGEIEVDVDDALIDEPKDDVFEDNGKKDQKSRPNRNRASSPKL